MGYKLLLIIVTIVFAATLPVPDQYEKGSSVSLSVLSQEQAEQLFTEFKEHSEIPFDYPVDGCFARATAMSKVAEQSKIQMGKVWVEGTLRVTPKSKSLPNIEWGYHVATTLYVKGVTGEPELKVFDPSMFDKPVSLEEWTGAMQVDGKPKPNIKRIYFGERFQMWPEGKAKERKKNNWVKEDLKNTEQYLNYYTARQNELKAFTKKYPGKVLKAVY
ncbi:protein-glutamine glutaminase family protein [Bdellovibrio sp. HCB274]|uniref:protein-glutamine glutaminase family protein n=1 Tax=Bdellovibrio sp. HCB274 TaxID=3394361 RepID=UPI0039B49E3C